jgi:hypothetical protein
MQVASLKEEAESLKHDNTLLRNALARTQQESAEYASCIDSVRVDSASVDTQRHHVPLAEFEDMRSINVRLQSELDSCRCEIAQAHDRYQVCSDCVQSEREQTHKVAALVSKCIASLCSEMKPELLALPEVPARPFRRAFRFYRSSRELVRN